MQRYSNCPHLWLTTLQPLSTFCLPFVKCKKFKTTLVSVRNVTYPHDIDLYSSEPLSPNSILESIWNPEFIFRKYRSKLFKKWLQCVRFIVWTICLLHVIHVTKRFFKMYFCFRIGQYRFHHLTENVRLTSARWDNFTRH